MTRRDLLSLFASFAARCGVSAGRSPGPTDILKGAPLFKQYNVGRYRVTIGRPRIAFQTATTEIHYCAMKRFSDTGTIAMIVDRALEPVGDTGGGTIVVSRDNGQTWGSPYDIGGVHTTAEPLTEVTVSGHSEYRGGTFAPRDFVFGSGGTDRRVVICPKRSLGSDGLSYTTIGTCTFSGFPADIGNFDAYTGISWFGHILQLAPDNWVTTILPIYVGNIRTDWEFFRSTDQGTTWTWVSSPPKGADEGCDEATIMLLSDGRIFGVSRTGVTNVFRTISADAGATWGTLTKISPYGSSPFCLALAGTGTPDYIITTGGLTQATMWPAGPDPVTWQVPAGYAPAKNGLYISSDPEAIGWPVVDIVDHHNAMVTDQSLRLGTAYPRGSDGFITTGYMSPVEIPGASAGTSHVLYNYDRNGPVNGVDMHHEFVCDAWITRTS